MCSNKGLVACAEPSWSVVSDKWERRMILLPSPVTGLAAAEQPEKPKQS